jgi:hypothetical protein
MILLYSFVTSPTKTKGYAMKFPTLVLFSLISLLASVNLVAETSPNSGTVAETIDAGGYTYIRIEESGTWIATTTLQVSEGSQVEYSGGSEMRDFYSKSLDRTFESIWFVGKVSVSGQDHDQPKQPVAKSHGLPPSAIPLSTASAPPAPGEIEKLDGGMTIEEITSDPAALKGQTISLRAKAIKVSANIMGKNWITLQDGTGTAPNNKLVATSSEVVVVGEVVTAKGVIRNDVDLGYGYHYEALLEEATFVK